MRQKVIKIALVLLLVLIIGVAIFGLWTWYQMNLAESLSAGDVQMGDALGGLVIPETAVIYGVLAGSFLLLTIVSIWVTYRLVMFPPDYEEEMPTTNNGIAKT